MSTWNFNNLTQSLARPATSAVVSGALTYLFDPTADPVSVFGHSVPLAVANGVSGALAVELSDAAHRLILPYIPVSQKWTRAESLILTPLLQALINWGLLTVISPGRFSGSAGGLTGSLALNMGIASAVSGGASEYVYEAFVHPFVQSNDPRAIARKSLWGRV